MLVKALDVIGLPVYTIKDGKKIHEVEDVIYDPKENKVEALLIDEGGWFSDAKIILIEDVKSIGEDAVVIDSDELLKKASDVKKDISLIVKSNIELTGTGILTESGLDLGTVSDIYFDSESGKVEEFEVSQGAIKDLQSGKKRVKISDIITIGEDATIVRAFTQEKFEDQSREQGITGAISKSRMAVSGGIEKAKETAPGLLDQARDKLYELRDETQREIKKLTEKAKERAQETSSRHRLHKSVSELKRKASKTKRSTQEKLHHLKTRVAH